MKIYGDYTFILDKLNIWNNSQVQVFQNGTKIVEFADKFLEEGKIRFTCQNLISNLLHLMSKNGTMCFMEYRN